MANTDVLDAVRKDRLLDSLRGKLRTLKMATQGKKEAQLMYDEIASGVKTDLLEVDGENGAGVRFWIEGQEFCAKLVKPEQELSWDVSKLVPALREAGVWEKVSTRVLDPNKLAAELSTGALTLPGDLKDYQYVSKDVAASVRFVNPTAESK